MSKESATKDAVKDAPPARDSLRDQALERALAQIEKSYGKGAIMNMDGNTSLNVEGIPTGMPSMVFA